MQEHRATMLTTWLSRIFLPLVTAIYQTSLTIECQCCLHTETSQLICCGNQLTGFYMRSTLAFTGLILPSQSNKVNPNQPIKLQKITPIPSKLTFYNLMAYSTTEVHKLISRLPKYFNCIIEAQWAKTCKPRPLNETSCKYW